MIRVLLVDDTKLYREAIRNILEHDNEIEVVACAADGNEAIDLCDKYLPDVILMDIIMPIKDGVESTKSIKEKYSWIKIIMLTASSDNDNIKNALKNGADGYVLKDANPSELIISIKGVMSGLSIIDKKIYKKVTEQINFDSSYEYEAPESPLTEREIEVIKLIALGNNNNEIASALFIATGRVKNIITSILQKLKLKDRTQIAVYAVRKRMI